MSAVILHFKESVNTPVTEESSQGTGRESHLATVFCAHDYILYALLIIGKVSIGRNGQPESNAVWCVQQTTISAGRSGALVLPAS